MVVTPNQQRHFGPVQCVLMSRYQEAYDYYSQAIRADPDSALLFSNRSGALAQLGRYVEALADADKCCQLRPEWYKSHVRLEDPERVSSSSERRTGSPQTIPSDREF
eukprot:g10180.t1